MSHSSVSKTLPFSLFLLLRRVSSSSNLAAADSLVFTIRQYVLCIETTIHPYVIILCYRTGRRLGRRWKKEIEKKCGKGV
jgi:hypothetical protein